ncbi:hypothetical protein [Streptomyces sp. NBRC 110611]|uniref:hypothetical protein n=1 Tax=Streptomyces sp. NBRC 110611 TaxID=1621259 RepID=UPI00082DB9DF|nr:hypothetical protein [Streptomyces sp. NBRC 110611]
MSRESDSSSSGLQGRGAAAYPSGTPPYGSPRGDADDASAPGAAERPEEPKTETTLTTRIKINIPGSRPIPPVVVRKPVGEEPGTNGSAASGGSAGPTGPAGPAGSPGSAGPAGSRGTPRTAAGGGGERTAERTGGTPRPHAPADEAAASSRAEKASDWFAPRKAQGGPSGSTTGSHAAPPAPGGSTPPHGTPKQRPDLPYFSDGPAPAAATQGAPSPYDDGAPPAGAAPFEGVARDGGVPDGGALGFGGSTPPGAAPRGSMPSGPSGATPPGSMPSGPSGATPSGAVPSGAVPGTARGDEAPFDPLAHSGTPFDAPGVGLPRDHSPFDAPAGGPSGPTTGPARGDSALNLPPGFGDPHAGAAGTPRSTPPALDETAELTPQPPAPLTGPGSGVGSGRGISGGLPGSQSGVGAGGPGAGRRDRISGDTLVSGIPATPGTDGPASGSAPKNAPSPFAASPAGTGESAAPKPRPKIPEPINPPKKGRNKLVLVGVAVVVLAGVAYGAGLLLDHADVPNGTTALGVDIGGTSKEEAVKKLEPALKDRRSTPLKLTVDGRTVTLDPAKAGLDVDLQTTVRNAAGRDYNPVSVIGSLFGAARTAEPAMVVDHEKIQVALRSLAGAGNAAEGGITFENGKAVPRYGTPYKAIDAKASEQKVADAYRDRVTTGAETPVVLASSTQQPRVGRDAVDKAMKQYAEPAMSGLVTVRTDAAHAVSFSPQKSIPKFLSFKVGSGGELVPFYDRAALKELYGDTFNGVLLTKGDGSKKPVTVEEVASAVAKALQGTTPAERIQTIGADNA